MVKVVNSSETQAGRRKELRQFRNPKLPPSLFCDSLLDVRPAWTLIYPLQLNFLVIYVMLGVVLCFSKYVLFTDAFICYSPAFQLLMFILLLSETVLKIKHFGLFLMLILSSIQLAFKVLLLLSENTRTYQTQIKFYSKVQSLMELPLKYISFLLIIKAQSKGITLTVFCNQLYSFYFKA